MNGRKKKILLVNTNTEQKPYPVPPLGLALIASGIEAFYDVSIYDGSSRGADDLVKTVQDFSPEIIGFSIRNIDNLDCSKPQFYLDDIRRDFFETIRKISKAPFVIGGSAYSLYPELLLDYFSADYGIKGEGEESFLQFLNQYFAKEPLEDICGLVTSSSNNTSRLLESFEGFSFLDKRLDFGYYKKRGAYPIQTKRGCFHHCIYCTYPLIEGREFRIRQPEEVVDEIEAAEKRIGPQLFEFVDSTFNDPAGYAEQMCTTIIQRKLKSSFRTMGINPANTSDKLFTLMKQAGFVQIDCTPDSASPRMIKNFRKNFTISELEKVADLLIKHNLPTMWFFIAAGPGETIETFHETTDFIRKHIDPLNMVHITSGIRIYPNTRLHKISLKQGLVNKEDNLLHPVHYFSPKMDRTEYSKALNNFARDNLNFVPASESKPSEEMMVEAMKRRTELNLEEPMFKTLLRIRHDWVNAGKMLIG